MDHVELECSTHSLNRIQVGWLEPPSRHPLCLDDEKEDHQPFRLCAFVSFGWPLRRGLHWMMQSPLKFVWAPQKPFRIQGLFRGLASPTSFQKEHSFEFRQKVSHTPELIFKVNLGVRLGQSVTWFVAAESLVARSTYLRLWINRATVGAKRFIGIAGVTPRRLWSSSLPSRPEGLDGGKWPMVKALKVGVCCFHIMLYHVYKLNQTSMVASRSLIISLWFFPICFVDVFFTRPESFESRHGKLNVLGLIHEHLGGL